MYYVGLDYHLNSSNLCILDEQGQTVKQMRVKGRWPQVMEAIKALPCPFSVAFEASCGYGLLYEQLCRIAHSVQVAHPRSLRLIYKAKRKNDRIDAAKLAWPSWPSCCTWMRSPRCTFPLRRRGTGGGW